MKKYVYVIKYIGFMSDSFKKEVYWTKKEADSKCESLNRFTVSLGKTGNYKVQRWSLISKEGGK